MFTVVMSVIYIWLDGIVSLTILAFGLMKLKRFKTKKTNTIFTLMFNVAEYSHFLQGNKKPEVYYFYS